MNLRELYATLRDDPAGARLVEAALFCDTDETGAKSIAYFSDIRVERVPTDPGGVRHGRAERFPGARRSQEHRFSPGGESL